MKSPRFWKEKNHPFVTVLRPFAAVYEAVARRRITRAPVYDSPLPVICVGNATMGGSGKTPVVESLCAILKESGKNPAVLLRGYGGSVRDAVTVDPARHNASQVGDEALLHARYADTIVSGDRVKGAKIIDGDRWHTHIVMDDGLQNPSLKKDVSFLVVDGFNPFGNEYGFPAGPLREPIDDAVRRCDAMIVIGEDVTDLKTRFGFALPVFHAAMYPMNAEAFHEKNVIAFAGIGRPGKFFDSLRQCDAMLVETHVFPDHHRYTRQQIEKLIARAERIGAMLVTTRKDWVRLDDVQRAHVHVLDAALVWRDPEAVTAFLKSKEIV